MHARCLRRLQSREIGADYASRIELLCGFNDVIHLNWFYLVSYEVFCNLRTNPPGIHQKNAGAFATVTGGFACLGTATKL